MKIMMEKKKEDTKKGHRTTRVDETSDRHIRRSGVPADIKSRLRNQSIVAVTPPAENLSDDADEGLVNPNTV